MQQAAAGGAHDPRERASHEDDAFMRSPGARTLRVLSELLQPRFRLEQRGIRDTIVFFGSSRAPAPPVEGDRADHSTLAVAYDAARELSRRLTLWGRSEGRQFLVASGAVPGIMEAVNRGAADAGGESIGFGIDIASQGTNRYVSPDLAFRFHYFFTRKFWFVYNAKAFVYFPGGFGTFDELFEVLTLAQTGKLHKRIGIVLFGATFWTTVIDFDALQAQGVISAEDRAVIRITDDVDEAERWLKAFLEENYGSPLLNGLPFDV